MTPKERMLAVLAREIPDAVPTFEWFIDEGVGEALCDTRDPIEIVERLDIDAVNLRTDYTKEWIDDETYVDEWGSKKVLTGDALAAATSHPIEDLARQADYQFPDPDGPGRFATLQRAVELYGDRRAVVYNLRDGFSEMRDLLGYENALIGMLIDPANYVALLQRAIEYNLKLAEIAVARFGIQIIATTDDVCQAAGPLIAPEQYEEFLAPAFREVIGGYKALGCRVIKHCDGDVLPLLPIWIEAGIDCLDPIDPGAGMDMGDMKARFGDQIVLKGNIDCTGDLCDGTEEQVRQEVRECLAKGMAGGGLILSSSNTIHRGVKPENYRAMLEELRASGRYE